MVGRTELRKAPPSSTASASQRLLAQPRLLTQPPALTEQIWVGVFTALLAGLGDFAIGVARNPDPHLAPLVWLTAAGHLVSMYLPWGLLGGALVGSALAAIRRLRMFDPLRHRLANPQWRRYDPRGFATGLTALVISTAFVASAHRLAVHFTTNYHRPDLALWALALSLLVLVVLLSAVTSFVWQAALVVARAAGRWATAATLGAGTLLALIGAASYAALRFDLAATIENILVGTDPVRLVWPLGVALTYAIVARTVRRKTVRRKTVRSRTVRTQAAQEPSRSAPPRGFMAAAACVVACGSLAATAHTYGIYNTGRTWLEGSSVLGLPLVRSYGRLADADHDGHSWTFGGKDCNDDDPSIHPGAFDIRGDGIDSDCFDGDGWPEANSRIVNSYGETPANLARPNFLIITADALRPDHLGAGGYHRSLSPTIDQFAETSSFFDHAIAQSSRSIRSIPAIFTGLYPSQIAYGPEYLYPSLLPENKTLAEILSQHGYRVAAAVGTDYFTKVGGFFQGFHEVRHASSYKPRRELVLNRGLAVLQRLAPRKQPWLLWIYIFNTHWPYLHDGRPSRFGDSRVDRYDEEIILTDEQIAVILEQLKALNMNDRTVVVIGSDHGEAFGEHDNFSHSRTLYEEELRSTLIIRAPGISPSRIERPVALMDLFPTLLNFAQIPLDSPTPARSLVPLMNKPTSRLGTKEKAFSKRPIFSELLPDGKFPFDQKAIRENHLKMIWRVREGTTQLFDLRTDPREQRDLTDARPRDARRLHRALRAWMHTNRETNRSSAIIARNRLKNVPRMSHRIQARIPGYFTLLGYDLPTRPIRPGSAVRVTFYYRVDNKISDDLLIEVPFTAITALPRDFHGTHHPLNGHYLTNRWVPGEIIRDEIQVVVPPSLRPPLDLTLHFAVKRGPRRLSLQTDRATTQSLLTLGKIRIGRTR